MLSIKKLVKGTAVYGAGQFINRAIAILLLPVFTNYLQPEEFGVYSLLMAIAGLLTCVFSLGVGVSSGIVYFEEKNQKHHAQTIWAAQFVLFCSVFLLLAICLPSIPLFGEHVFHSQKYNQVLVLSFCYSMLMIMVQPAVLAIQFMEKAVLSVALSVISMLLVVSLNVYLVMVPQLGVTGIMTGTVIGNGISLCLYLIVLIKYLSPIISLSKARRLLKIGYPYIFGAVAFLLVQYVDRYMIEYFKGLTEVGIYSVGYSLGMVVMLIVVAFSTAWTPFFNSFFDRQGDVADLFGKVLKYYVICLGWICLAVFICADPVVKLMAGNKYSRASSVVGLISVSQALYGCYLIFMPGFYFQKKTGFVNFILCSACLLNIVLNYYLIPLLGIQGAAWATIFSFLLMSCWAYFSSIRYLTINYRWKEIIVHILIFLVCGVGYSQVNTESNTIEMFVGLLILLVSVVLTYLFLRADEKKLLMGLIKLIPLNKLPGARS